MHLLLLFLVYFFHQSIAYSINIHGQVDLGKDLGVLFKDSLLGHLLNKDGTSTIDIAKLLSTDLKFKSNKDSLRNSKSDGKPKQSPQISNAFDWSLVKKEEEAIDENKDLISQELSNQESDSENVKSQEDELVTKKSKKNNRKGRTDLKISHKMTKQKIDVNSDEEQSIKQKKGDEKEATSQQKEAELRNHHIETFVPKEELERLHVIPSDIELSDRVNTESDEKGNSDSNESDQSISEENPKASLVKKQKSEPMEKPLKAKSQLGKLKNKSDTDSNESHLILSSNETKIRFNIGRREMNEKNVDAVNNILKKSPKNNTEKVDPVTMA